MRQQNGDVRIMVTAGVSALVTLLLSVGVIPRIINDQNLNTKHTEALKSLRKVHTIKANVAPNNEQGTLPASISAIQQTTINARIDGYLKERYVDIGDVVKTGQLLAEIEVPTVVEEVAQADADFNEAKATLIGAQETLKETQAKAASAHALVNKAKADYEYALVTAKRWEAMAANGSVSLQSRDEKIRARDAQLATLESAKAQATAADDAVETARAQITVAKAAVLANDAKFRRTKAKEDFKYVRAPFNGVITDRKVDAGALINAGGSSSTALFSMANIDELRIYINVPQTVSRYMKPGQRTVVTVSELAGQTFPGLISKVSGALDPQTRTRQTEIRIPNSDHKLFPGMYAQVQLTVDRPEQWVIIPGTTLVPQPDGMKVVVVEDGKAVYKPVVMGRNLGDDVEIKEGLHGGELLVINPPVDLLPGEQVDTTAEKGVSENAD